VRVGAYETLDEVGRGDVASAGELSSFDPDFARRAHDALGEPW